MLYNDGSNYFTVRGTGTGGGGGGSLALQTNGTPNGSQTLLNLAGGVGVNITDDGSGTVTVSSAQGFISGNGSPAGVAFVQAAAGTGDSLAFTNSVVSGNVLAVAFKTEGDPTGITVTDTVGTSYTLAASITGHANNLVVYTGTAAASGANTVTIGSAPNNFDQLAVMEISGLSGAVDVTASSYNGTNPANLSITTTVAYDLLLFVVGGFHSANTFAFGGGFTLDAQSNGSDAIAIGHQVVGAAGTYTGTVTITGGSDNSPLILVGLKPSSSSTPGVDGDMYLDVIGKGFWGPRASGAYPLVGTLN